MASARQLDRDIHDALLAGRVSSAFAPAGTLVQIIPTPPDRTMIINKRNKDLFHGTKKRGVLIEDARIGPGAPGEPYDVLLDDGKAARAYGFDLMPVPDTGRRTTSHLGRKTGKHVAHHAEHWEGSEIQSLLFNKEWTPAEAKRWATEHGYKAGKVHVTDDYIRLRQFPPIEGTEKRTITLGQGIKAVLEQVK